MLSQAKRQAGKEGVLRFQKMLLSRGRHRSRARTEAIHACLSSSRIASSGSVQHGSDKITTHLHMHCQSYSPACTNEHGKASCMQTSCS